MQNNLAELIPASVVTETSAKMKGDNSGQSEVGSICPNSLRVETNTHGRTAIDMTGPNQTKILQIRKGGAVALLG